MKPSCFLLEGTSKEQAGAKQLQAGKLQVVVGAASHAPTQGQMDWLSNNQSIIYDHYVVAIFLRGILYRLEHIWELSRKRGSHQEPLLLNGNGKLFGHQEETLTSLSHLLCAWFVRQEGDEEEIEGVIVLQWLKSGQFLCVSCVIFPIQDSS